MMIIQQAIYRFSLRMKNDYSKLFLKLLFIQYFALTRDTIDKGCFLYFFVLAKAKIESIFLFWSGNSIAYFPGTKERRDTYQI